MASVNKVILIGNLGQDPEVKFMPSGGAVANVSIATTDSWKDKNSSEKKERTEWHRVVFFNRLAEIVGEYLKKGSQVYIDGKLQTRKWQDQSGQDRWSTEILGSEMKMLGSRADTGGLSAAPRQSSAPQQQRSAPQTGQQSPDAFEDDLPF